jgi:hypothetical protein
MIKKTLFWNVSVCILVQSDRRFRVAYCFRHQGDRPVYVGSKQLWNVGQFLPYHTALKGRLVRPPGNSNIRPTQQTVST